MIRSSALGLLAFFAGLVFLLLALEPLPFDPGLLVIVAIRMTQVVAGAYLMAVGGYLLAIPLYELHERVNEQFEAMKRRPKPRPTYTDETRQPISTEGA